MKPARAKTDEALFKNMPKDVQALQKKSRKELRLKERRRFRQVRQTDSLEVN